MPTHNNNKPASSFCPLLLPLHLQLWGVPSSSGSQQLPGGLPKLLALLWHEGKLAWDVKWCPNPSPYITTSSNNTGASSSSNNTVPLQGLLAAALASGDVVVWGVPTIQYLLDCAQQQPQQLPQQDQQQDQPTQALSLRMPYVWHMPCAAVGGSLSSCCSWLPFYPHNKVLVGCWDGNVVIWQLSLGAQGECDTLGRALQMRGRHLRTHAEAYCRYRSPMHAYMLQLKCRAQLSSADGPSK
jgi:hypothetical protein